MSHLSFLKPSKLKITVLIILAITTYFLAFLFFHKPLYVSFLVYLLGWPVIHFLDALCPSFFDIGCEHLSTGDAFRLAVPIELAYLYIISCAIVKLIDWLKPRAKR